ncbi:tRNA (adenosine(37)-N6)-threonylcarbamoyltransferase complex dimerization subunit type 1 TsaB [Mucilaginibacter corticis]|uniref:tRNA (Adenosine(37)-N6)-threonylcarbamoyltransferase complex dimerization subunit type 1 TsaB n=1 Tax=Mucilaginibacter corticis TaxID=2597670 RepID=A0A556MI88_9SPHI|nr:tRNA (adenosine(37)-N6)-threonylcarbamoyltransferase complex dimerization subunit type 1 TsaB [Mucilaginibacter corticis]TSJ39598.1 tRNA (adenosine(37)-N6)-threonylcarbamoyltransferase complex dimerization subunit type 1 TsaB [Mucilaginibacter corticis]
MTTILQIETATTVCSVALARDGEVIGVKQLNERNIHAEIITLYIDELIASSGLKYADIGAVAVSSGPGSYTGLRIGVSTAKGLCFALDKPLIAVHTLDAMAHGIAGTLDIDGQTLLCPMIDARRMEVYTALFDINGNVIKPTSAEIIDEHSFATELKNNKIAFFGDGADKCRDVLGKNANAKFITDFTNSATHLTKSAAEKFIKQDFEDVAYFEPYYLKDFLVTQKKG